MSNTKYFVLSTTEGCATNLLENAQYKNAIDSSGSEQARSIHDADVVIVNTCGYSQQMEDKAMGQIKSIQDNFPSKKIVVGGCLPSINKKELQKLEVNDSFRPGHVNKMLELAGIEYEVKDEQSSENLGFDPDDFSSLSGKHIALNSVRKIYGKFEQFFGRRFQPLSNIVSSAIVNDEYKTITVSTGCLGECAFCSIKMAKGSVKSRPLNSLLNEFETSLKSGNKKFWLLGDDIGCYGQDIGTDIVTLLESILSYKEDFELVVNYVEPMFLEQYYERFLNILKDKRIININFPLQSGSRRIVFNMRRFYHPENILKMMNEIKLSNSSLVRKTNLIVGYPGESWSDFFLTLKSVFHFDALVAFRFTPRRYTIAAKLKEQLPDNIIELRFIIINVFIFIRHAHVALASLIRMGVK